MSPIIVAFQGEHGAYSEEAVRQHFGREVETLPCPNFQCLFEAVLTGEATYGMLPVENALAGTVAQSYELLFEHDMRVQAEVILRVQHMLLAPAGTKLSDIKRVKSHPQALAQCEGYLRRRGFESVVAYDTAGSARDLAANPEPHTASIASALAGELYGLTVLDRGVEDEPYNSTRFFVIGLHDAPRTEGPQKTSIVFAVRHRPAALYECLGAFARHEVNLTKLESRPMRSKAWQYWFYLDFEGHAEDPQCKQALMGLLQSASMVKLLGSYPAATSVLMPENDNGHVQRGGKP
ncbi:MAG: prephenate dehydratase [Chloroflexota bacterium]|nr:prephenate dehydratase [Chloroflexota bacterium]GIK62948.1 MAG: prephenate dehydratase [Chloroflexota bacterium]